MRQEAGELRRLAGKVRQEAAPPGLTLVRVLVVLGACLAVGFWLGKVGNVFEAAAVGGLGLLLLVVLGEVGKQGLVSIRQKPLR